VSLANHRQSRIQPPTRHHHRSPLLQPRRYVRHQYSPSAVCTVSSQQRIHPRRDVGRRVLVCSRRPGCVVVAPPSRPFGNDFFFSSLYLSSLAVCEYMHLVLARLTSLLIHPTRKQTTLQPSSEFFTNPMKRFSRPVPHPTLATVGTLSQVVS
jgi:hypothetical protein